MDTLAERVVRSKVDRTMREELIREYMPFILSCASKQSGRYIRQGIDDESAIAMMAFDEAIKKYEIDKGEFLSFAKRVIGRRLIDNYRKSNLVNNTVLVDFSNNTDHRMNDYDVKLADEAYGLKREEEERFEEIEIYKRELGAWGISFSDLVKNSPKHDRLRREYMEIAKWMTLDDKLMDQLMRTHRLPINKIIEKKKIPRKKLERGRIYILNLIVILTGEYRYIREYIDWR